MVGEVGDATEEALTWRTKLLHANLRYLRCVLVDQGDGVPQGCKDVPTRVSKPKYAWHLVRTGAAMPEAFEH